MHNAAVSTSRAHTHMQTVPSPGFFQRDAACPKAADAAAAAAAAAEQAVAAPAAAGEAAAGGAPRRAAGAESSSAGAAARATSDSEEMSDAEEKAPQSKRARLDPASSKSPAPASSRKCKADDSAEAVKEIVGAIDAVYKPDRSSPPIEAWDLLKELCKLKKFEKDSVVHEKVSSSGRLGKHLKDWVIKAIDLIAARSGNSQTVRRELTRNEKLVIHGLCKKG